MASASRRRLERRPNQGQISTASKIQLGLESEYRLTRRNGKTGVSPRVSLDVSRINLRGKR